MSNPPDWLAEFVNAVAAHIHAFDSLAPLGCHFCQAEQGWEVTVFAGATEIIGGRRDGHRSYSRFHVDVLRLSALFDAVRGVFWQAQSLGRDDEFGPHITIEGDRAGLPVALRILAHPPAQFAPGRQALTHQSRFVEMW